MEMQDLKKMFGLSQTTEYQQHTGKQATETYQQWGHRMAGLAQGSCHSVEVHLQRVYSHIRREQAVDEVFQEKLQREYDVKIAAEQTDLEQEKGKREKSLALLEKQKNDIEKITNQLAELKGKERRKNSEAMAYFIIGLFVIIPLTGYLFLFYSSTAYSAFFKEIDYTQSLTKHLSDPRALSAAGEQGWTALAFILGMTFIFMALGLVLHNFSQQDGAQKYGKMGAIIVVTFIFDAILAYTIAKNMYNAESLTMITERPAYNLSMAVVSEKFWTVIFAGFLAYIMWGLLFDFTMENYNKLDLNTAERMQYKQQLKALQKQEKAENKNLQDIDEKIKKHEGEIKKLEIEKQTYTRYNYDDIVNKLSEFFTGWFNYMNGAEMRTEQTMAKTIYDTFIKKVEESFNKS